MFQYPCTAYPQITVYYDAVYFNTKLKLNLWMYVYKFKDFKTSSCTFYLTYFTCCCLKMWKENIRSNQEAVVKYLNIWWVLQMHTHTIHTHACTHVHTCTYTMLCKSHYHNVITGISIMSWYRIHIQCNNSQFWFFATIGSILYTLLFYIDINFQYQFFMFYKIFVQGAMHTETNSSFYGFWHSTMWQL